VGFDSVGALGCAWGLLPEVTGSEGLVSRFVLLGACALLGCGALEGPCGVFGALGCLPPWGGV
jgi:hypothetical protein